MPQTHFSFITFNPKSTRIAMALCAVLFLLSPPSHSHSETIFGIKMVVLENGETRHIKFNRHSGETWWSSTTEWKKIQEPTPLPRSDYEYSITSTGMYWRLIRIDTKSGEAWKNSSGQWVKFSHPTPTPPPIIIKK